MIHEPKIGKKRFRLIYILLLTIGVGIIFYLSWLPQSQLSKVSFIPNFLANWADRQSNDNLRTAIPFTFLGLLSGIYLLSLKSSWHWWLIVWGLLIIVACIAEIVQLSLPLRSFGWWDIYWGALGSLLGLTIIFIIGIRKL